MKHDAHARLTPAAKHAPGHGGWPARAYRMFALNLALSLIPMYLAMFTMIDGRGDFRNNVNMLYMALTMLAPMGMIMLAKMGSMYGNKGSTWRCTPASRPCSPRLWATRAQALVDDKQFVDSMVPHHSGAILMCREPRLTDPELLKLCGEIVTAQRAEISRMEAVTAPLRASR